MSQNNNPAVQAYGSDPEAAIAAAAAQVSNWGRWGPDDARGTVNFIDESKRIEAASLIKRGITISLSLPFDNDGPQNGWKRRVNPVHTMTSTGQETAETMGLPHGLTVADDAVFMPLQCSTQWDGLGHVFDHGIGWNNRRGAVTCTSEGDLATGIENVSEPMVTRGVLLDVGRAIGGGELEDGYAITPEDLDATIAAQGGSSRVGRGDIVLVRTGQLTRVRRGDGWGAYAGGPAPGLSFTTATWLHTREIAAIATDTWGAEVRPNEFPNSMQPLHQVLLPHLGLMLGEMWDLDRIADDCATDGVYEFMLAAQPLPFTGAVGSPVNPIALK